MSGSDINLKFWHRSRPLLGALGRSAPAKKVTVSNVNVLHLILVFGAALACSGCGGSLARHREKVWVQPAIVGGGWSAEEIESVTRAVDGAAARHGLKRVPGIPPWHLFEPGRRITCNEHLTFLGSSYILSVFHTQKDSRGPIIVEMDHDPGCPEIWETNRRREQCRMLWSDVGGSLRETFGERVTEPPNPQSGANGRQPFSAETNRSPVTGASRRSP